MVCSNVASVAGGVWVCAACSGEASAGAGAVEAHAANVTAATSVTRERRNMKRAGTQGKGRTGPAAPSHALPNSAVADRDRSAVGIG